MGSVLVEDERANEGTSTDGDEDHSEGVVEDREVHRLRDLDRRQRFVAGAFAVALLLAPLLAFARYLPDWAPAGDPAYMAQRALDVGTGRTPLVGQPSTAANYIDTTEVHHLGPSHFFLMAPFVRVLGVSVGMLLVSVLIVGSSLLVAAWGIFRQLGLAAAVLATVILGTITFTTGASSLVNPVSSSISGYPLLCSAVLLWCVLCGDIRLLPLTALWVSFTAQQHLSVLPALAVMTAIPLLGCLGLERRNLRTMGRWLGGAAAVSFVVWLPVALQELFGDKGNISQLRNFASHSDRPKLGYRVAVDQLVHVLGWPPFLGETNLGGEWFFGTPSATKRLTALVVVALLGYAAFRWYRAGNRARLAFVALAFVTAFGGVMNGASVPKGIEQFRMPFYHWAFVLMLFVITSLVLLLGDLLAPVLARLRVGESWPRMALASLVPFLVIVVPAVVNPSLDRRSNTLLAAYSPVTRDMVDQLGDAVMAESDRIDGPVLIMSRGQDAFVGIRQAFALELETRGVDIAYTKDAHTFVHDDMLGHRKTIQSGLVVVLDNPVHGDTALTALVPGELLVDIGRPEGFDIEALDELVETAEAADEVVLTDEAEQTIAEYPDPVGRDLYRGYLESFVGEDARDRFTDPTSLRLLLDTYPFVEPRFDRDLIERVLESMPGDDSGGERYKETEWRLRVYLLDREQVLGFAGDWELYN